MAITKQRSAMTPTMRKPSGGKAPSAGKAKAPTRPIREPEMRQTDLSDPMDEEPLDDLFDEEDDERR